MCVCLCSLSRFAALQQESNPVISPPPLPAHILRQFEAANQSNEQIHPKVVVPQSGDDEAPSERLVEARRKRDVERKKQQEALVSTVTVERGCCLQLVWSR